MAEPEVEGQPAAGETEEERLRAENERLRAENAALKQREGGGGAPIPPRPHTTDPQAGGEFARGHRAQDTPPGSPPAGGSLDAIMQWREQRGRSARSRSSSSTDFGPPVLRARSWLAKTPLSTKPNPVGPVSAAPARASVMAAAPAAAPACPGAEISVARRNLLRVRRGVRVRGLGSAAAVLTRSGARLPAWHACLPAYLAHSGARGSAMNCDHFN